MRFGSLLTAICLFLSLSVSAQLPQMTSSDKASPIVLQKLEIDVSVMGTRSSTTCTMTFRNPSDKILEGTFLLPLPEGAQVTRYALDINGKMREGVPVEKARATEVFESVEKRRIDPGLLEKTEGNVFRTRIYPIPAQGERSIIIAFEQDLPINHNQEVFYHLPLETKDAVPQFTLNVKVWQPEASPVMESTPLNNLALQPYGSQYCAFGKAENAVLTQPLSIRMARKDAAFETFVQERYGAYYFYLQSFLPAATKAKKLPERINVIWDVSLSGLYRNTAKEIALLQAYLEHCRNTTVALYTISNTFKPAGVFPITNGNTRELVTRLKEMVYDGGTDFSTIRLDKAGETLLFTDGLSTLSDFRELPASQMIYTLTASPRADYALLKDMAERSGGAFVNLNTTDVAGGLEQLTHQPLLFLGIRPNSDIEEHFPSVPVQVQNGLNMAGRLKGAEITLTLQFGYGKEPAFERTVHLRYGDADAPEWDLSRVLAQKKIEEWDKNYDRYSQEILALGKKHNLVTRNTSLLVLEEVADYVQHGIEPPAELWPEYKRLLKERQEVITENRQHTLKNALHYSEDLWKWWNTTFPVKQKPTRFTPPAIATDSTVSTVAAEGVADMGIPPPPPRSDNSSQYEVEQLSETAIPERRHVQLNALQGQVAGVQVQDVVVMGYSTAKRTVSNAAPAPAGAQLLIVNGVPASSLPPREEIEQMETLDPKAAVAIYGSKAMNGVVIVTTKGAEEKQEPQIELQEKHTNADYLKILAKTPLHQQYRAYLQLRDKHLLNPVFYYDVASHFLKHNRALGLQILTNLGELDYQNHELHKLFAFKLKELGESALQQFAFKKVLQWRPQEPQSYRDYALALADGGHYQAALDTLYRALTKEYQEDVMSDYEGIEEIIVTEITYLAHRFPDKVNTGGIPKKLLHRMPVDIRVVLNWNMNDTDIDLWVTDPKGEKCFYSHKQTTIGGRMSEDFTEGYGPEQFLLKKALKGKYTIQVHYYGENGVKIAGKTTLLVEVFTNYGRSKEQRKLITLQLEEEEREGIYVGSFEF